MHIATLEPPKSELLVPNLDKTITSQFKSTSSQSGHHMDPSGISMIPKIHPPSLNTIELPHMSVLDAYSTQNQKIPFNEPKFNACKNTATTLDILRSKKKSLEPYNSILKQKRNGKPIFTSHKNP